MPEAAVHKNDFAAAGENQVRPSRQAFPLQPEPIAERMNDRTDANFRLGPATADGAHIGAAALGRNPVHFARAPRGSFSLIRCCPSIGTKEPFAVEVDHVRWIVRYPHFRFPCDTGRPFSKICFRQKGSDKNAARSTSQESCSPCRRRKGLEQRARSVEETL